MKTQTTINEQEPLFECGIEYWQDIEGYESRYQVSSLGRVRSVIYNKKRVLKPFTHPTGYLTVRLYSADGSNAMCYVHRLVAKAFIPNDDAVNKTMVNHINHIRNCNFVDNLEWVTPRENIDEIAKKRMSATRLGRPNYHLRKPLICTDSGDYYDSITACATKLNLDVATLSRVVNNKRDTCGGLHFQFAS